jgi:hypothetical protein
MLTMFHWKPGNAKNCWGSFKSIDGRMHGLHPLLQDRTGAAAYVLMAFWCTPAHYKFNKMAWALADAFISSTYR